MPSICGVIKQNQSEVGQIQFSFFLLTVCTIFTATFAENSIEIGKLFPEIQRVEGCQKQQETKDIFCFVWLYLKINISDFRLILLVHIKYVQFTVPRLAPWSQVLVKGMISQLKKSMHKPKHGSLDVHQMTRHGCLSVETFQT